MTTVTTTIPTYKNLNIPVPTYCYEWDVSPYIDDLDEDGTKEAQRKYKQRLNDFLCQCRKIKGY